MKALYSDHFVLPLPPGHRFPMGKYAALRERVPQELGGPNGVTLVEAPAASEGELALAHTPRYVQAVFEGLLSAAEQREIGFPWSERMVERVRRSVGATVAAARFALAGQGGVAASLAGGTHHSYADKGSGYCVFNDVAVTARLMQAEHNRRPHAQHFVSSLPPGEAGPALGRPSGGAISPASERRMLKVAIIDLDVHQGNGTASILRDDETVFTLSVHGEKNFPFRKEASDLDVDLPDGTGDADYLAALDDALAQLAGHFFAAPGPKLVLYLAGADPHEGDRLGRLKLSFEGLMARDQRVFGFCARHQAPVVVTMAGGYGRDMATTVQAKFNTLRLALGAWRRWQNLPPVPVSPDAQGKHDGQSSGGGHPASAHQAPAQTPL